MISCDGAFPRDSMPVYANRRNTAQVHYARRRGLSNTPVSEHAKVRERERDKTGIEGETDRQRDRRTNERAVDSVLERKLSCWNIVARVVCEG